MKEEQEEENKTNAGTATDGAHSDSGHTDLMSGRTQPEISKESREERDFISGMIHQQTNDLSEAALKRKRQKAKEIQLQEIIELQSGLRVSIGEIVLSQKRPYEAQFPNEVPFYSEIYRVLGLQGNPNDYHKPRIVADWTNEIIYGRFDRLVITKLKALNPTLAGSFHRKDKHFQYLNGEGLKYLVQFRDEAIALMKTFANGEGYAFRKKLFEEYGVPYQTDLFDKGKKA